MEHYSTESWVRCLDYAFCIGIVPAWLMVVFSLLPYQENQLRRHIILCFGIIVLTEMIFTVCFMDDFFYIENTMFRNIVVGFNCCIRIACIFLLFIFMGISQRDILQSSDRKFVLYITIFLSLFQTDQLIVDLNLFFGQSNFPPTDMTRLWSDIGALSILICNFLFILFVYKADFSSLFIREEVTDSKSDIYTKLDILAESHSFTNREREVLDYIYEGFTNPDIAKNLDISVSTVKYHVHHIYEKTDVSNRMELIHLINSVK